MPIRMAWEDEEKTILRHIYEGIVTADEFHRAVDENYALQSTVSHPVDVISDNRNSKNTARLMLSSATRHTESKVPPNQRLVVVVGASMYTKILLDTARRFAPNTTRNMHVVTTLEEALTLIEALRSTVLSDQR